MVFVSCDFKQALENLSDLTAEESKKFRGPPFSPVSITPFDLFPGTMHFEVLVHLQRLYE